MYEASPKHTATERRAGGRKIAKEPTDGASALDFSFPISQSSPRRIGVDPIHGEFVVFDRTGNKIVNKQAVGGTYHGHVHTWNELEPPMKRVLLDHGIVDSRGKLKLDPSRWDSEP